MMDLRTFENGLDRWGGVGERWPRAAREGAEALLASSAAARALQAEMAVVESVLAEAPAGAAGGARFAAMATRQPQQRPGSPVARRLGWGAAAAAALALGLVVGDAGRGARHEDGAAQVLASALGPATGAVDVE